MKDNETASFNIMFYPQIRLLRSRLLDLVEKHNATAKVGLTVDPNRDGTASQGDPAYPKDIILDMPSHLLLFKKPNGDGSSTSLDLTNIEDLDGNLAYPCITGSPKSSPTLPAEVCKPPLPLMGVVVISDMSRPDPVGSVVSVRFRRCRSRVSGDWR